MKVALVLFVLFSLVSSIPVSNIFQDFIPDQYIVTFERSVSRAGDNSIEEHFKWLERQLNHYRRTHRDQTNYGILHRYNIASVYKGYSAKVPPNIASMLSEMPNVAYIEQDSYASVMTVQPTSGSWGLSRISQKSLPLNSAYTYPDKAGEGVTVYVIDTGVDIQHPDFEGRAVLGANFSKDPHTGALNPHGTHCAGTVASATFGVAKKASIVSVKVLDNSGSGSYSSVIAGINWMASHATNSSLKGKALASMSLGGGKSQSVNDAVAAAVKAGFPFAVAAGNNYKADACNISPASEPLSFTVAASDSADVLARFSNVGPCVDVIAPGVEIVSTWVGNTTNKISGTSMAAPHVAGVLALALAEKSFKDPLALYEFVSSLAIPNSISSVPSNTKNLLLFNGIDVFPTTNGVVDRVNRYEQTADLETKRKD